MASLATRSISRATKTIGASSGHRPIAKTFASVAPQLPEFLVVFKGNCRDASFNTLELASAGIQQTFRGHMKQGISLYENSSQATGQCFACRAPDMDTIREAVLNHEDAIKGKLDVHSLRIWPLETVHTSQYARSEGGRAAAASQ